MMQICDKCKVKGKCPVSAKPENIAMGRACAALEAYCSEDLPLLDEPMDWVRGWLTKLAGRGY